MAESNNLKAYFNKSHQLISESKNTGVKTEFTIWSKSRESKCWRILPTYVKFEEAMKALKEGKEVHCEHNNEKTLYNIKIGGYLGFEVGAIKDGKWTIEGDSE